MPKAPRSRKSRNVAGVSPRSVSGRARNNRAMRNVDATVQVMAPYAVLDYRVRWLGLPVSWRTMIREYDPPARFVDVQVRGPYDRWEHRHLFLEERAGTWVEDRVTYRLPLGPLGRLVHALIVERQLAAIWAYRRQRLSVLVAPVSDAIP